MNRFLAFAFLACSMTRLCAAAPADWIAQLKSPDITVRRAAVDRIQTLDDPRIPEACLPLLHDDGLSIRRQAARAIGSRYYQIPKDRQPNFIAAMRQYLQQAPEDDRNVAERGLGLLTRDLSDTNVFSVSPDKKWVLYEQRRRPMIATADLTRRQLLAPKVPAGSRGSDDWFDSYVEDGEVKLDSHPGSRLLKLMCTSESIDDLFEPHWSPDGAALELQPAIQRGFFSPICIWRSRDGAYRVFDVESLQGIYGNRFSQWSTAIELVKWQGPKAILKIYDQDNPGSLPYDPVGIVVSVNTDTWKIAVEKK